METSVFVELERAELAARERRLAAEDEARGLLEAAQAEARRLERAVDDQISAAVAERRSAVLEAAAVEIEEIERQIARLGAPSGAGDDDPAFRDAVDLVVAAVLAEESAGEG